jgi:two-component system chemotaxis response regulator CheY
MNPMEFLGEFQAEAIEKLDIIAGQLLRLERDATNPQPVREMFLAAHTVKGGAAMLRLTDVEYLAHALEDLLSVFRDEQRALDAATADVLFKAIDMLRSLVGAASVDAVGAEPSPEIMAFAEQLRAGRSAEPARTQQVPTPEKERRALVVDDSATVRALNVLLLEAAGFSVEEVEDGDTALTLALQQQFNLVVSGLQTRGLGGLELTAALRRTPAYIEVPIVLMSADADAERSRQAVDAGAQVLLRKSSFDDERLTETVRSLLPA